MKRSFAENATLLLICTCRKGARPFASLRAGSFDFAQGKLWSTLLF